MSGYKSLKVLIVFDDDVVMYLCEKFGLSFSLFEELRGGEIVAKLDRFVDYLGEFFAVLD